VKKARVRRKIKERLMYQWNEQRLEIRTKAKALVYEALTLSDEGLRRKED